MRNKCENLHFKPYIRAWDPRNNEWLILKRVSNIWQVWAICPGPNSSGEIADAMLNALMRIEDDTND